MSLETVNTVTVSVDTEEQKVETVPVTPTTDAVDPQETEKSLPSSKIDLVKFVKDMFTLDGRTYYNHLVDAPPQEASWFYHLLFGWWYGKYIKFPRYHKDTYDAKKASMLRQHFFLGMGIEIFLLVCTVASFAHHIASVGVAADLAKTPALWAFMVFTPILILDMLYSLVALITKLVIYLMSRPKDMSFWTYLGISSYVATPERLKALIGKYTDKSWLQVFGCNTWFSYVFIRGFGYSIYWRSWHDAILVLTLVLMGLPDPIGGGGGGSPPPDLTQAQAPKDFTGPVAMVLVPAWAYAGIVYLCVRWYYYLTKELEYFDRMDLLAVKIEDAEKSNSSNLDHLYIERDRAAWRATKQKSKIGGNFVLWFSLIFVYFGMINSALSAIGAGQDWYNYTSAILNFMFQCVQPYAIMARATKTPFIARSVFKLMDKVPLDAKGYLFFKYLHSTFVKELPNVPSQVLLFLSAVINLIQRLIEHQQTFSSPLYTAMFATNLPALIGSTFALTFVVIYPFFFVFVVLRFKISTPKPSQETQDTKEKVEKVEQVEQKSEVATEEQVKTEN